MALSELVNQGYVKHIVSTNVDGLHVHSGVSGENLSELHGNAYLEKCWDCGEKYLRSFDATSRRLIVGNARDHLTGRKCTKCGGELRDSIINFGENLPEDEFKKAQKNSGKADLALVLGTSMRVRPACELPLMCHNNDGNFVLVNLQKTPCECIPIFLIFLLIFFLL